MSDTPTDPALSTPTTAQRPPGSVPPALAAVAGWTWRLLLIAFGVVLVLIVLYRLRTLTVPIFVALLLTTMLLPLVHRLTAAGLKHGASVGIVFVSTLVLLGGTAYLLFDTVIDQFTDLGSQVTNALDRASVWFKEGPLELSESQLNRYVDQAVGQLRANTGVVSSSVISGTRLAGEVIVGALLALVLTVFFLKDGRMLSSAVIGRFPSKQRPLVRAGANRAFDTLGQYLRGVALTGVVDAVLIGIALIVVGVPLIPVLMVLTFFGAFFPVVGAVAAGALAVLVALVNGGFSDALIIVAAVLIVQQVEGQILQPYLVGGAVRLHPVVIIISLTAGAIVAGILGAFVAVPLVAMVAGAVREVEEMKTTEAQAVDERIVSA